MLARAAIERIETTMKVLVTGSASGFAQTLFPRLLADPQVELVIGVDREQCDFEHERFVQVLLDLRSPQLQRVLQDVDAAIHLSAAGHADPGPKDRESALTDMQVECRNLCTLAAAAGLRCIVHLSSALVYDTRRDGRRRIREESARRAPDNCAVFQAMQAMEDWLDEYEQQHPELCLVRLRPHWIVGPKSTSLLNQLLATRVFPRQHDPQPLLQCVHEDDVAEAVRLSLGGQVTGAVNLACADAVSLKRMARLAHWIALPVPAPVVAQRLKPAESGCFEALRAPLVLDSRRARKQLGWRPQHDSVRAVLKHR
jgi:UDP-glucose 4-epimerase